MRILNGLQVLMTPSREGRRSRGLPIRKRLGDLHTMWDSAIPYMAVVLFFRDTGSDRTLARLLDRLQSATLHQKASHIGGIQNML